MQTFPDETTSFAGDQSRAGRLAGACRSRAKCCGAAKTAIAVDNGNNGDGCQRAVARFARVRLHRVILRRWETIAEVRETESRLSRCAAAPDQDAAGR